MKKVLVTGGAGFIGSHTVVELAQASFTPIIVDDFSNSDRKVIQGIEKLTKQEIRVYEGNCADHAFIDEVFKSEGPFTGVIHFAANKAVNESVIDPLKYYRNNIGATEVMLSSMRKHGGGHLVFSSSCTVYGQPEHLPVTESTPFQLASSPYGYSKQVCERMICDTVNAHQQLSAVMLRYFNPIGAHPSGEIGELPLGTPDNLVPYITQTAAGWREELIVYGHDYNTNDGTCVRDFIHVVDLAKAHVAALQYLEHSESVLEAINLGTGHGNSVKQVIEAFEEASGVKLNWRFGERRKGDVEKIFASADKAKHLLNWTTQLSLHDALKDAWNWQQRLEKP